MTSRTSAIRILERIADRQTRSNQRLLLTNPGDRVGAPVARGASHRTGLVPFTSGSSGRWVMTPTAGRLTTSRYPRDNKSCSGASMC